MAMASHTYDMWDEAAPVVVAPVAARGHAHDRLRHYQLDAVAAIHASFQSNRSTLLVLATGLGKTQIFSSIAKHWPGRVLVLAHRGELVDQARARLEEMTGEYVEVEQAQLRSSRARIVVGSLQTVTRPDRLEALTKRGGFSLVICDEAHHLSAPTFRRPIDHFRDAKILGVTATPDRGDGKALGAIFDDVAYTMDIRQGIEAGYLVPLKGREVTIEEVNLDRVSVNAGDLAAGELDEAMIEGVEGVVRGMLHHACDKQGVVFFPGVKSAHLAAARLNAIKPGCATSVDGETDVDDRRRIVRDFKEGRVQFLANCMVATEGFDAPAAAVIGLARPTKSRAMYAQMVGRGTRVLPGTVEHITGPEGASARVAAIAASKKPHCTLIDFVGLNTKHSLMTPQDLLGGDYDEATKKKAKELGEDLDNSEKSVSDLLEMSHKELTRLALAVKSKVRSTSREFNPFEAFGISAAAEQRYGVEYGHKPMTPQQRTVLAKFGFTEGELKSLSRHAASKLMDTVFKRIENKLASRNQLALLAKHGVAGTDITFEAASKAIGYIRDNGWGKRVNPAMLRAITEGK